ncbi:MAG: O-methyltransferase [Bacteroidales bacterium]|nr:O-methyltransferase [Bacteroidales bacterium]MBR6847687.1 O-methyltransferase [Bacteroidales bacterium]
MIDLTYAIEEYLEQHATPMDEVLHELYRETHLHAMNPRMASGPVQGRFLQLLCQLIQPKKVLEIGTFTGFATICMARGMGSDGLLTTIEANEEYEGVIRKYLAKAAVADRVRLIIGDAKEVIPTLEGGFDMVFIDADKISYPSYYDLVIEKLNPGGVILADNVLWEGKVLNVGTKERDTKAIQAFNDKVQNDPRVENVLLPLRDGLMMIRKL